MCSIIEIILRILKRRTAARSGRVRRFFCKKTPCRVSIIIGEIILSHRFARGSRRGSGRRPELPRLGAERPPRRAEPRTRGEAGRPSEPRHRQVRPSRQGGRNAEKRPLRAERPVLPRPGAAVLSARWGLTAEFGMGSGDPPLHGSARGRRSRGNRMPSEGPGDPPRHPGGCMRATRPSLDLDRSLGNEEELGLLVALA